MAKPVKTTRFERAFSLMEVLAAVTILAVILALFCPAYASITRKAEAIKCASNLRQLHTATMLFYSDQHFFPIGYSDDYIPGVGPTDPPGGRWSRIRRHGATTGIYTQWQIEIAPYLGSGLVEQANQQTNPNPARMDAHTAWDSLGDDPSAWRLPMEFRCPAYNRKLGHSNYKWQHAAGDVYKDHYGYCYNQYVMVGNGTPEASYSTGEYQHKGRDPRNIISGYAPPNGPANTLMLFCSRWGVWQAKSGTGGADLSGVYAGSAGFSGYPLTEPHGSAGDYCGIAAGIHNGTDNFLFLDGHIEILNRSVGKDRRRMNKAWWRPLPLDASFGHYGWNSSTDYHVAYLFDENGRRFGHLKTNGQTIDWWTGLGAPSWWTGSPASSNYNWDY